MAEGYETDMLVLLDGHRTARWSPFIKEWSFRRLTETVRFPCYVAIQEF